jgi:hypothetical protein
MTNIIQPISGLSGSLPKVSMATSDAADQPIAVINTPQTLTCSQDDLPEQNMSHDHPTDITTILVSGRYSFLVEPLIENGSGANTMFLWPEISTDGGSVFVAVPNSASYVKMSANSSIVLTIQVFLDLNIGDKVRWRVQGDSLNLKIASLAAAGAVPAVPSNIMVAHLVHEN